MQIHPAVVLTICDYCSHDGEPDQFSGPLYGDNDTALACSRSTEQSASDVTLDLLRKTSPALKLIGWYYVGVGLTPEEIKPEVEDSKMLVLFELPASGPPLIAAFWGTASRWVRTELRLQATAPSRIALDEAVNLSQAHDERRAKMVLRERVRALKEQLRSASNDDVAAALGKYSMLRKVQHLHETERLPADDLYYEILAEVVMKTDAEQYPAWR